MPTRTRRTRTPAKPNPKKAANRVNAAANTLKREGKLLGGRARAAGNKLVSKVKGMSTKKLVAAAATAVGVGAAAVSAVVATRKRRRKGILHITRK